MVKCRHERGIIPHFVAANYQSQGNLFKVVGAVNGVE